MRPPWESAQNPRHRYVPRNNVDRLHLINIFVAVVDKGGFAGAGRKLNISPPVVTRAINDLEAHLGVRLLTRTTRVVRVTEAGARYADDCRRDPGAARRGRRSRRRPARGAPRATHGHGTGGLRRDVRHAGRDRVPVAIPGRERVVLVHGPSRQHARRGCGHRRAHRGTAGLFDAGDPGRQDADSDLRHAGLPGQARRAGVARRSSETRDHRVQRGDSHFGVAHVDPRSAWRRQGPTAPDRDHCRRRHRRGADRVRPDQRAPLQGGYPPARRPPEGGAHRIRAPGAAGARAASRGAACVAEGTHLHRSGGGAAARTPGLRFNEGLPPERRARKTLVGHQHSPSRNGLLCHRAIPSRSLLAHSRGGPALCGRYQGLLWTDFTSSTFSSPWSTPTASPARRAS